MLNSWKNRKDSPRVAVKMAIITSYTYGQGEKSNPCNFTDLPLERDAIDHVKITTATIAKCVNRKTMVPTKAAQRSNNAKQIGWETTGFG